MFSFLFPLWLLNNVLWCVLSWIFDWHKNTHHLVKVYPKIILAKSVKNIFHIRSKITFLRFLIDEKYKKNWWTIQWLFNVQFGYNQIYSFCQISSFWDFWDFFLSFSVSLSFQWQSKVVDPVNPSFPRFYIIFIYCYSSWI